MDGFDPDMVYEVPDTPDRLTTRRPIDRSSKPSWERVDVGEGINCCSLQHRDIWHSNNIYPRRRRDSTQHDGRTAAANSHEDLFRQADLARSMLEPAESKSELGPTMASNGSGEGEKKVELGEKSLYPLSHPTRCRDSRRKLASHEHNESSGGSTCTSRLLRRPWSGNGITLTPRPVVVEAKTIKLDEDNRELRSRDKGKGIDLCSNLKPTKFSTSSCRVIDNKKQSEAGYQNLTNSVDLSKSSSSARSSDKDNRSRIDLCKNTESNMMEARSLRSTGRRRLVRNGCISPLNIERGKSILKEKHDRVENNGVSSHEIYIVSPDSDDRHAEKLKGKVIVDDIPVSDDQQCRDKSGLSRVDFLSGREVTANVVKEDGTDSFQDKGWRTTRAHRRKPSIFPSSDDAANGFENNEASSHPFYQSHETAKGSRTAVYNNQDGTSLEHQSNMIPVSDSQSRHVKGKRKFSLTRARTGECSSSTSGGLEMLNLQSSRQTLNLRSVRGNRPQHEGTRLGQVIEVDDLRSPEVDYNSASQHNARASDHSVDRARQVESDEMLARQLQEELYNETLRTGGMEEIDATIAWSLLQEEDGHHASHRRENQSRSRDTSSSSARAGSHQSFTRATNRGRRPMSSRMAQLRRELNRPVRGGTGLEMRLDFLEALELAFGDGNDTPRRNLVHRVQRDFNENDYEMLLALDENNNHTGASERQINNLPQSVIQNVNPEETCAVCLEAPSVGETIRHLPCLHKFHKECIDSWLRRKMSCPICKSGIT
ncbi:uncharacterized protein M6B38_259605 [Iris pallida]|uniref:RING-type domain-containing protein n=1 Tax=Iris pallida TaxID=29817 RepID=A0AAX6IE77_IRIPA|nr:uncharacterized protein M6B38_259605 [Iris pallida]